MTNKWFGILAFVLMAAVPAWSDSLTITLDSPTLTGSPGDVLQVFGTLTNVSADTIFLNDDNVNLEAFPLSSIDDSPFFANAPISLDSGDNSGDIELLDITIPSAFSPGDYDGTFQVLGGPTGDDQILLGTANFTVDVPGTSAVPEPSCFLLLGMALAGMAWLRPLSKSGCGAQ
jgi:hypothetical protein